MKIQTTYPQPKPAKKLALKKQSIRVLTHPQTSPREPTPYCTLPC